MPALHSIEELRKIAGLLEGRKLQITRSACLVSTADW